MPASDTCLVVGNGRSLRDVPLEFLRKYDSFGTNKIYLLDGFTPTYYVCINPLVISQNIDSIKALTCEKFVRHGFGIGKPLVSNAKLPFSFDPLSWVNEGYTVTYVCLQLAYWMGYKVVLLVGVDHRYQFDGRPNERQKMGETDPNHFDPSYFARQEWHTPDLDKSERYYRIARSVFEADGRRIINLTPDSALNVFERGELAEWK